MRKTTQKRLMALGIIFIFALSSIAFVFSGFGDLGNQQNQNLQPLDRFVVDGEIDPRLESAYIQGGFTFLKYYFAEPDFELTSFIEQAPTSFRTPGGQIQIIVLKIESASNFVRIANLNGELEIREPTADKIFDSLCSSLLAPPAECIVGGINSTSQ